MAPTLRGLLGKPGEGFDGIDLTPYLRGEAARPNERLLFWEADR